MVWRWFRNALLWNTRLPPQCHVIVHVQGSHQWLGSAVWLPSPHQNPSGCICLIFPWLRRTPGLAVTFVPRCRDLCAMTFVKFGLVVAFSMVGPWWCHDGAMAGQWWCQAGVFGLTSAFESPCTVVPSLWVQCRKIFCLAYCASPHPPSLGRELAYVNYLEKQAHEAGVIHDISLASLVPLPWGFTARKLTSGGVTNGK